jgi:hypothetical protein
MAQPAPKKEKVAEITPNAVVTINNQGVPSQNPVTIPSRGSVQFVNPSTNTNNFIIQLWDKENTKHPVLSIYLPVNDDAILMGDPEPGSQNALCPYNIITVGTAHSGGGPDTGGNNRIVVGGGGPTGKHKSRK